MVAHVNKLIDIFKVNENVNNVDRQKMLNRYMIFTEYLYKGGLTLYFLSCGTYFVNPIFMYMKYNEITPIVYAYLPGIDENTGFGFIVLTIFHINTLVLGTLGSACSDFSFTMIIVNVPILANIIADNITELNKILMQKMPKRVIIRAKLLNIFLQHLETRTQVLLN